MSKSFLKFCSFFFAAFSIITTFFSIFSIQETWIKYSILTASVVCAFIAVLFLIKFRKYNNGLSILNKAISRKSPETTEFTIDTVNSEARLMEIWEISQGIYKEDNVPFNTVLSWWKCYRKGIYVLRKAGEVVGYLSIWPVKKQTMKDITNGTRRERELKVQSIVSESSPDPRIYWYITNLVVTKKYRRQKAVIILLREGISKWFCESNLNENIEVCAHAYSSEGESVLKKFGFYKKKDAAETLEKQPIYIHSIARKDLGNIIDSLC